MTDIAEEMIQQAQERAERRGKEWLEREEKELDRDMTFAKQVWSLITPTDQEVTTKDYEEKVKQLLEAHLRALTGA